MLSIPALVKARFQADGIRKNLRIHFPNGEYPDITNGNIEKESLRFTESLCSQDVFKFGLAEASVLEFETVGIGNMFGMTIEAGIEVDVSNLSVQQMAAISNAIAGGTYVGAIVSAASSDIGYAYYRVPLGVFRVDSCPRNHQAMTHRKVTAYTADALDVEVNLPTGPWSEVKVDLNALIGYADRSHLSDLGEANLPSDTGAGIYLWDSGNNQYEIYGINDADDGSTPMLRKENINTALNQPVTFVEMEYPAIDMAAYEAFGQKVATALTAAGLDLTYNGKGSKVFATNEEALRTLGPLLFRGVAVEGAGCLPYEDNYVVSTKRVYGSVTPLSGVLTPIIGGPGLTSPLPRPPLTIGAPSATARAIVKNAPGGNVGIVLRKTAPGQDGYQVVNVSVTGATGLLTSEVKMQKYGLAALSGVELYVKGTPAGSSLVTSMHEDNTSASRTRYYVESIGLYSFVGLPTWQTLIAGALELGGKFAKTDRLGGYEVVELDPTAPQAVASGDFHGGECWWDEYDVSPIGTVSAAYGDGQTEFAADIGIGGGASIYDMTDNYVLENLAGADLDSVTAILNGDFASNAENVGFTPTEMTMQGWPWIEAGDALEITAEDGTIVDTFALRVELSGIQRLTMYIESKGGEVIWEDGQ